MTYRRNVEKSKGNDHNPRGGDKLPERRTERGPAQCWLVQISENIHTKDDHDESQGNEAMRRRHKWPMGDEIGTEQVELGYDEGNCSVLVSFVVF